MKIAGTVDEYISGKRANWLIASRRARLLPTGELQILEGSAHTRSSAGHDPIAASGSRVRWTPVSGHCVMNGTAINRATGE